MGKKPQPKAKSNGRRTPAKGPTPGCYVLSLSVENARCFGPKQTLDCSDGEGRPRQWTVILGDNGTGKTTLLQMALCHEWVAPPGEDITKGDPRVLYHVSGPLRRVGNTREARSTLTAVCSQDLHSKNGRECFGSWAIPNDLSARYDSSLYDFVVHGYGASRRFSRADSELHTQDVQPDDRSASLFHQGAVLRDAEKLLLNLDYSSRSSDGENQREILDQVAELLLKVLPDIEEVKFEPGTGYFPKPRVEFLTPYGWVPLRQLGHGYQTMIAWVVDFVSRMVERYPDSDNPLAEPAVCLVDEIDLHLHPVWQRKVIGYLSERFPNTQFIVTAHSPLVVQAAANANANIAVLVRSEKPDADGHHYVEIRNNPEDVRNWRLDQILTSDLFGGLSLNPPKVGDLFKEKEHLVGLKRPTSAQKARLAEIEAELAKLPVGDDAREVKEMQAIREAIEHLQQKRTAP